METEDHCIRKSQCVWESREMRTIVKVQGFKRKRPVFEKIPISGLQMTLWRQSILLEENGTSERGGSERTDIITTSGDHLLNENEGGNIENWGTRMKSWQLSCQERVSGTVRRVRRKGETKSGLVRMLQEK